jgi:hypothetical protein
MFKFIYSNPFSQLSIVNSQSLKVYKSFNQLNYFRELIKQKILSP